MSTTYVKVTDALTGAVTYEESPQGQATISSITGWLADRSTESTTHLGAAVLAVASPSLTEQAITAVTMAASGNYIGAATNAVPVLIALGGAIAAIVTPTPKGPTDVQIQSAVAALSRDDLIRLLTPKTEVSTGATASQSLGPAIATVGSASSGG